MEKILYIPQVSGTIRAPSSKSEAHRHLIVAALSALYGRGATVRRVFCTDLNEDIEATIRCLSALGADMIRKGEYFEVTPITALPSHAVLDCGESGSTLRFFLPIVCALGSLPIAPREFTVSLVGHGRLPQRPLSPLYEILLAHGASLSPQGSNPLIVSGKLTAGTYIIDGSVSSQFISGLLFALPLLPDDSRICVTGKIESAPYIDMTVDAVANITDAIIGKLPDFLVRGKESTQNRCTQTGVNISQVGGDWSGAAFFLTAGVLSRAGHAVMVTGLDPHTRQGDAAIVNILQQMGGRIALDEQGNYMACSSSLHGCEINATQIPDLVPILAVAASVAEGETHIVGASRLRLKESDRLATVTAMLTALGANIVETGDGLIICGTSVLRGGTVDAAGDHRIAMSAAIAATRCTAPVTIIGAETVAKSYPAFWRDFDTICIK